MASRGFTSIEICAGAGGQAIGLEAAGFEHLALVEVDPWACTTLRLNRPGWNVIGPRPTDKTPFDGGLGDVRVFDATPFRGQVDLLAGGVPCPPFSKAGKQLGYAAEWRLFQASDFGVPQLRPRSVLVAMRKDLWSCFGWPSPDPAPPPTVGEVLREMMAEDGWELADEWAERANVIAPTLVGGSKKHGGPDLGPTRARREWADRLGVNGGRVADAPPRPGDVGMPHLTVRMAAAIQGFPPDWEFAGRKTQAYRQVGNAFPPPMAAAIGRAIRRALEAAECVVQSAA